MTESLYQTVLDALQQVEHPSIAATLAHLGIAQDIDVNDEGKATLTLVLPFPNVPENIRDFMAGSLAQAAQTAGGEVTSMTLRYMNDEERQTFLEIEQANWRA